MLVLSISTYGLPGDSVAVVSGAMIVAPLMLPIAQVTKPEAIQQVMIRTAPHLLDLMAALMTGSCSLSPNPGWPREVCWCSH